MNKYHIKRSAKRIRIEMPVRLGQGSGITRDVSHSGVFFITDQSFSPGATFDFDLQLN